MTSTWPRVRRIRRVWAVVNGINTTLSWLPNEPPPLDSSTPMMRKGWPSMRMVSPMMPSCRSNNLSAVSGTDHGHGSLPQQVLLGDDAAFAVLKLRIEKYSGVNAGDLHAGFFAALGDFQVVLNHRGNSCHRGRAEGIVQTPRHPAGSEVGDCAHSACWLP